MAAVISVLLWLAFTHMKGGAAGVALFGIPLGGACLVLSVVSCFWSDPSDPSESNDKPEVPGSNDDFNDSYSGNDSPTVIKLYQTCEEV